MMASFPILVVALQLFRISNAQPTISFPLNAQLPPVARIDREFSYVFSPYTFRSDSNITYSLGDHPAWLSLDQDERRLFGRPQDESVPSGDVVGQTVEIIATDLTGSTALNATLVVSRHKGPTIKIPIEDQMTRLGPHSAPASLLAYPRSSFKYTFDPNTFDHEPDMINYYAVSANSSPLPSWVTFDPGTLTFSGITPPFGSLIQPPQTFNFELVASDIVGFSAVSMPFSIMVGTHKLTAMNPIVTLSTMRGSKVSFDTLKDEIHLDGMPVKPQDLKVSTSEVPPWLTFHFDTWEVEGTPQQNDHSTNFTIKFGDTYEDTLEVLFMVKVATGLFQSTFQDMQIKAGEDLDIDLAPYFRDAKDIEAKLTTEPSQDWLKLSDLGLSGRVPEDASGNAKISIEAASKSSGLKETESLGLRFVALEKPTSLSTSTSTSTSASPSQTHTRESSGEDPMATGARGFSTGKILLATIIPVIAVACLIMLLICFFRRRRTQSNYIKSEYRHNISKPIVGSLQINGSDASIQHVEKTRNAGAPEALEYTPEKRGYAEMASQPSTTGSDGSESLSASGLPRGYMANVGPGMVRDPSHPGTVDRQSWFTVEGSGTAPGSVTAGSQQNVRAFPESRQQLLPPPEFLIESPDGSIAGSLDLAIPLFGDLGHHDTHATAMVAYNATGQVKTRQNSDELSTTTSSSAALPGSDPDNTYRVPKSIPPIGKTPRIPTSSTQPAPLPNDSSEEKLEELRALNRARISSHQWLTRHQEGNAWDDVDSSNGSKSLGTQSGSFGSSENWRPYGRQETRSPTYGELVENAPFHPSRPSTVMIAGVLREGAQPGERDNTPEWMSPSKWGPGDPGLKRRTEPPVSRSSMTLDSHPMPTITRVIETPRPDPLASHRLSRLTETSSLDGASDKAPWNKEPKASEGSFKMFI